MELDEFKRVLQHVMIVPVAVLLVLAVILVFQVRNASSTVQMIEQADRRIALATLVERYLIDEETGLRGYQITADPRFLEPYQRAEGPLQQAITDLQGTYSAGVSQDVQTIASEHQLWRDSFAEPTIRAVAAGEPTLDLDLNLTGKARMDVMRSTTEQIARAAGQRRVVRIELWGRQVRNAVYALILLGVSVGLFIALFTRDRLEAVSVAFRRSLDLQRRRAEQLFRSEQHLRTTLASIGDGVITCDQDGAVQTMNLVAQDLTGWTEAEAYGRPLEMIFKIVDESARTPIESPVAKVKRLNRIVGLANHTVLVRKDGSELAIDDSGAPIRDETGALTGVVMVFRDVTMARRTRAALVANEKLAVAGRLAATIAHEIHNPLDSVANLLYLLQGETTPEESRHFLELAQQELNRVTQISRAMLSLYRESKAPVPIDLKDTLEDLMVLMERRMQDLGVVVKADLPEGVEVEGFPAELRQVFTNLINNAAEAAGAGGRVQVRLTAKPEGLEPSTLRDGRKPEPGALIEISDTGPGIAPDVQQHLFQPFFTTKGERGTGLGLWVCQGIIRKHGGILELASRVDGPKHGTVASVFLASKPEIDAGAV